MANIWRQTGMLAVLVTLGSTACSHRRTTTELEEIAPNTPITLSVTNDNPQDVTVYVSGGSERQRLGLVTTGQTQTFTVPAMAARPGGDFEVMVHPVGGGGDFSTGRLLVSPGDNVELRIAASMNQTSYKVSSR